jgi:hypothetical protein
VYSANTSAAAVSLNEILTYYKRHVKCDERTPPPCERCAKLHLECEYADLARLDCRRGKKTAGVFAQRCNIRAKPVARSISTQLMSGELAYLNIGPQEAHYIGIYRHRVADHLPCPELWCRTILRECANDEIIRHSVVAVGALSQALYHERGWRLSSVQKRKGLNVDMNYRAAMTHYGRAMALLRSRLADKGPSAAPRTLLIVNFLFILYELIQSKPHTADNLMVSGVLLLKDHLIVYQDCKFRSRVAGQIDDDGVRAAELLLPRMVSHNSIGAPFCPELYRFGNEVIIRALQSPIPDENVSVEELLAEWDINMSRVFLWINRVARPFAAVENHLATTIRTIFQQISDKIAPWGHLLTTQLQEENVSESHRAMLPVLMAGLKISTMLCACFLDSTEMAWDDFTAECQEALRLVGTVMPPNNPPPRSLTGLMFEDKLVFLVRLIAEKCRHKAIRKTALAILRQFLSDNSIFDAESIVMASETHAAIEEEGRDKRGHIPSYKRYSLTNWSWDNDRTELLVALTGTTRDYEGNLRFKQINARLEDFDFGKDQGFKLMEVK